MVICLERGADLHVAQLMPLPLTVSCFSKIQISFTFLIPAHPGRPRQRAVKRVCACVCVALSYINPITSYHKLCSHLRKKIECDTECVDGRRFCLPTFRYSTLQQMTRRR